jgi:hypothetical protein
LKRAKLQIGSQQHNLSQKDGLGILRKEFTPALYAPPRICAITAANWDRELPLLEHFLVSVFYDKRLLQFGRKPDENISLDSQEILRSMQGEGGGRGRLHDVPYASR